MAEKKSPTKPTAMSRLSRLCAVESDAAKAYGVAAALEPEQMAVDSLHAIRGHHQHARDVLTMLKSKEEAVGLAPDAIDLVQDGWQTLLSIDRPNQSLPRHSSQEREMLRLYRAKLEDGGLSDHAKAIIREQIIPRYKDTLSLIRTIAASRAEARRKQEREARLDQALASSMDASDPPPWTTSTATRSNEF